MQRHPWPLCLILCVLALLGCDSAQIVSTNVVVDAGCLQTLPPERPDPALDGEDDGEEHVFVFRDWDFLPTTPNNGYDLDGICSTDEDSMSCVPQADEGVLDGTGGTDNAYANVIVPQINFFVELAGKDPQAELHGLQAHGQFDVMLRIRGWNGEPSDSRVQVDFMETVCGLPGGSLTTTCPEITGEGDPALWDGSGEFIVSEDSVLAGDETRAQIVDDNAYVANGQLVAELPSTVNLSFPLRGESVRLGFTDTRFIVPLPADDEVEIPLAVLSGRWPRQAAAEALAFVVECPGEAALNAFAFNTYLDLAMDVRADPREDNMDIDCNAMSIALTMRGFRANYGGYNETMPSLAGCD